MKNQKVILLILTGIICLTAEAQILPYTTGEWNSDSLGNHRVLVEVGADAEAVKCTIPWRRKDQNVAEKELIIVSAQTGERVTNIHRTDINREFGKLIFEALSGKGLYYIYYLPYKTSGSNNYPTVNYLSPQNLAEQSWLDKYATKKNLPEAHPLEMQSINAFHSFFPMEIIATQAETKALLSKHQDKPYILFPEDRMNPIKMWSDLPYSWVSREWQKSIKATAMRNEYFAFQVGLYAWQKSIEDIEISFSDMKGPGGAKISSDSFSCYNKGGVDWTGEKLIKEIPVEKGDIQALWMGVMIPEDAQPGEYMDHLSIHPKNLPAQKVDIILNILPDVLADHGDSEPAKHSRLRWLDSRIAEDNEVISPYVPIKVQGNEMDLLGRKVVLSPDGLPEQIMSQFTQDMTGIGSESRLLLNREMGFTVELEDGSLAEFKSKGIRYTGKEAGRVSWEATSKAGDLIFVIKGELESDGFMVYSVEVSAKKDTRVADISFSIPMKEENASYMLGLSRIGGFCPDEFSWKWDPYYNNDGPWIGDVNIGLQASFRDLNYERPLNTNFYHQKPLKMPHSWYNDGSGGIRLNREGEEYIIQAYSGAREIKKGETLNFNMQLLLTPFHSMDTHGHWKNRYYHRYTEVDSILAYGGNTINVHHANEINPFINYPFMTSDIMKAYIDEAHDKDAKVKIYYTVRELTNICPEIWALKSLGDEILSYGPGGGYSWIQEHLDGNYIAAWFVPALKDAAVINSGVSRWHNYYLEGLNWLVKNVDIDGIYIDDVAFDRSIMKRVRKILRRGNPGALIDLHSANQFNPRDGFANSANLYLEHFAYIDRLWFGEYFDYDAGPEYWLTEVSGIPFGLMGEMLEKGGNQWRGMLYGMTSRAPWSGDPTAIWKVWDDFGINDSQMIGYWVDDCPVKTGRPDILASVYQKEGQTLIALASWAHGPARIELEIDWEALGLDPEKVQLQLPLVKDFQEEGKIELNQSFTVPEGKGFLIIAKH
jgi:hypothetical protein